MDTEIYYFSGTGNSLAVARDIAGRIGERLRSIPAVMNSESIRGEPTKSSFLESRQLMDRGFRADENCNGCAICSRICPVSNIEMADGRPVWQQRCEQCFACLQWCPQESIQFGDDTTRGKRRYHHPDVTLADMLRQASPESSARTSI